MHNDLMELPILLVATLFADILFADILFAVFLAAVLDKLRHKPGHLHRKLSATVTRQRCISSGSLEGV